MEITNFDGIFDSWWPYIITMAISIISAIKVYMGGPGYSMDVRIDGKIVILTGGSSGIGLETAKELARRGARVILTCRDALKGRLALETIKKKVPNAVLDLRIVDISLISSIKDFVQQIKEEVSHVDILINNAGICGKFHKKTVEGNEIILATNYLGPFMLTHLLLPLLEKAPNARVINVSALAHVAGVLNLKDLNGENSFEPRAAFAQSKLALTLFTKYMASKYNKTNITFNSVNPGIVHSTGHFYNSSLMSTSIMTKISLWPWIWLFLKTPHQGCQTIIYAAVEPALENISGCYFSDCSLKETSELVKNPLLAEKLYNVTCDLVNFSPENQSEIKKEEVEVVEHSDV